MVTMKFEKVRPGEYRARLEGLEGGSIWVTRQNRAQWVWFLGGTTPAGVVWETDNNGPFPTKREAIADAIANYEEYAAL